MNPCEAAGERREQELRGSALGVRSRQYDEATVIGKIQSRKMQKAPCISTRGLSTK